MKLSEEDAKKQELYRDARITNQYHGIWTNVGKCVFCDLKDKYIVFEEKGVALTVAVFAYTDGHLMIVPRRHVRSAKELTDEEWQAVRKLMYLSKKLIKQTHKISGVQYVQKDGAEAQSTVEHYHFHCVPFDSPDLSTWNYRQLKNTPIENASLYKDKSAKINDWSVKYNDKYA